MAEKEKNTGSAISDLGAIVLWGGSSSRMQVDKSELLLGDRTLLQCVLEPVMATATRVVVVGRHCESLARSFPSVEFALDENPNCGPLEGIRVGLEQLAPHSKMAFVTACDVPLLKRELIAHLASLIDDYDAVIPIANHRVYGTTAVYQTRIASRLGDRIQQRQLQVKKLVDCVNVRTVDIESLRIVDPDLDSFLNINTPSDYQSLLQRFPPK